MASGKPIRSVLESISRRHCECSICQDWYKDPRILDCQHTFCLQCIQKVQDIYIAGTRLRSHRVSCPVCTSETELPNIGAHGLKTDFRMVSLMEDFETEKMMTQEDPKCPYHKGKAMRFFCTTCGFLICRDCTVEAHPKPKHVYIEPHQAAMKSRTELLPPLEGKLEEIEKRLAIISQTKRELSASKHRITAEVQKKAEELKQEITKQATSIIEGTERVEKKRQQQLDGTKKTLQLQSERIEQSLESTTDMINIAQDSNFPSLGLCLMINMDVKLLSGQNTPEVDSSQLGLMFRQGQGIGDINLGELVTVASRRWELYREITKQGSGPGEFYVAISIAARRHDEIAVADLNNCRVQILGVDGTYKCQIPLNERPNAVALAKQSNRLIVVGQCQVKVFNQDNSLAFEFSAAPPEEAGVDKTYHSHAYATIKKDGNILIAKEYGKVVTEHSPTDGALLRTIPVEIKPSHLAVRSNGGLIISSWGIVHVTDVDGTTLFIIIPTIGGQPVIYCNDVWSDHSGIFIAVCNNKQGTGHIHHYDDQGAFLTCIAQGLDHPRGITMTPAGQMAVADQDSVKIYH